MPKQPAATRTTVSRTAAIRTAATRSIGPQLLVFGAIAFGVPWLLWLLRAFTGIDVIAAGGMAAAGLATFVAVRWVRRPTSIARDTALVPLRPVRRLVRICALTLGGTLGLAFLAVGLGALAGVYPVDLGDFSGIRSVYAPTTVGQAGIPIGAILTSLISMAGLAVVMLPFFFAEEWAWRGFLLPRLAPLGLWPALVGSGVIWALWHLPGYVGAQGIGDFVPFLAQTVFFGILLGWLRLRTGLIWPGVVAHAAHNTLITGFVNVVFADDDPRALRNPWTIGIGGWPGWVVMLAFIVVLAASGEFVRAADKDGFQRSYRFRGEKILAGFLGILLVATLTGGAVEHSLRPTDGHRYPPPGRMVDIGGYSLHIRCVGTRGPTIVFESGWGDSSTTWAGIQNSLAASGQRSCAYDRAGYAWSQPANSTASVVREASDLDTLLTRAGERAPYVFVGHSWGGHILRQYRERRPDRVAGMLLLDIADEQDPGTLGAISLSQANIWSFANEFGALRTGTWMIDPREPRSSRDNAPIVYGARTWKSAAAEMREFDPSTRDILALPRTPGHWGPMPLTVISARHDGQTGVHHASVAKLSTRGRHLTAPTTDHYLHLAQPALIHTEINHLINAIPTTT